MIPFTIRIFIIVIIQIQCALSQEKTLFPCKDAQLLRNGRVVGGVATNPGDAPFMVSLTRRGGHFCGAVVINEDWLLTAGHCICNGLGAIYKANQIRAVLGQYRISDFKNNQIASNAYEINILQITPHPEYICGGPENDIALLKMANHIEYDEFVRPACITLNETVHFCENDSLKGMQWATITGWGWTNEDHTIGERADTLQKANVTVWSTKQCNRMFALQSKSLAITDRQLCAGRDGGGVDSCWADSGGPLMSNKNNLIGIVSTGIGCARPGLPGIYTNIFKYLDWIREITYINK